MSKRSKAAAPRLNSAPYQLEQPSSAQIEIAKWILSGGAASGHAVIATAPSKPVKLTPRLVAEAEALLMAAMARQVKAGSYVTTTTAPGTYGTLTAAGPLLRYASSSAADNDLGRPLATSWSSSADLVTSSLGGK